MQESEPGRKGLCTIPYPCTKAEVLEKEIQCLKEFYNSRLEEMKDAVSLASGLMQDRMDGFPDQFMKRGDVNNDIIALVKDISWLKIIGWGILGIVGATVALAISLYFPMLQNQKAELQKMQAIIEVNTEKIRSMQLTDAESKGDRVALHKDVAELTARMTKYHEQK